jgi:hypothetical protein
MHTDPTTQTPPSSPKHAGLVTQSRQAMESFGLSREQQITEVAHQIDKMAWRANKGALEGIYMALRIGFEAGQSQDH